MIRYLLQFIIIILVILPFYLKLRKPWKRERGREIAQARDRLATGEGINLVPFRSIQVYFIHYGLDGFLVNFVGNIVMFMLWGFGLTLLWKKNRKLSGRRRMSCTAWEVSGA